MLTKFYELCFRFLCTKKELLEKLQGISERVKKREDIKKKKFWISSAQRVLLESAWTGKTYADLPFGESASAFSAMYLFSRGFQVYGFCPDYFFNPRRCTTFRISWSKEVEPPFWNKYRKLDWSDEELLEGLGAEFMPKEKKKVDNC